MIDFKLIKKILSPESPTFPNSRSAYYDELLPDGLTMGTLYIGKQGSGKTTALARHLVDYFKSFPRRAVFVLDPSGSLTDDILAIILSEPKDIRDRLIKRLVYDELGHPEWVIPLPEFHKAYNTPFERQVQRVAQNFRKLAPELVSATPVMGGIPLREVAPELFRLLTVITNDEIDPTETWQITEAKKLLVWEPWMKQALAKYGSKAPSANFFFKTFYMGLKEDEKARRSYGLRAVLNDIEATEIRARVGYHRPGWTPTEAINKGLMVLINGQRLNQQDMALQYLMTQSYSLIMDEISKRTPHDPNDEPVAFVMDEVYSLLSIPSMAPEISRLSPQYRSRKLQLYIVLQNLSQLSDELRPHIWSLGNIVCFSVFNFADAYELAQQLFPYIPEAIKMPAKTDTQQPLVEPDRGQFLTVANQIKNMQHRECIVRRQISEKKSEKYILWVKQTKEVLINPTDMTVLELKDQLLKERGVRVRDALEEINKRKLTAESPERQHL